MILGQNQWPQGSGNFLFCIRRVMQKADVIRKKQPLPDFSGWSSAIILYLDVFPSNQYLSYNYTCYT